MKAFEFGSSVELIQTPSGPSKSRTASGPPKVTPKIVCWATKYVRTMRENTVPT